MKRRNYFRKESAGCYEYDNSGYFVQKMANNLWDAYQPSAYGWRLWESTHHTSRARAATAIAMERRRIARAMRAAMTIQGQSA